MVHTQSVLRAESEVLHELLLSVFPTEIGWMGVVGQGRVVHSMVIGHSSAAMVRKSVQSKLNAMEPIDVNRFEEDDWLPELRQQLQEFANGEPVEFAGFELQLPRQTRFRDKVLAATRTLRYGQTTTYGDLAKRVGHPGAARAVGTVMSTNRFPILIPCHRVLASGGKLGGYSSPTGTCLKQRMLDMERQAGMS